MHQGYTQESLTSQSDYLQQDTRLMFSLLLPLNLTSFSLLRCPFVHSNVAAVKISIDSSFFQVGAVIYEPLRKSPRLQD